MAVALLASSRFSCGQDASLLEDHLKEEHPASKIRSLALMESIQTAAAVVVGAAVAVSAEDDFGYVVGSATAAAPTGVDDGAPSAAAFVAAVVAAAPFATAGAVASVTAAVVAESEVARRASYPHE